MQLFVVRSEMIKQYFAFNIGFYLLVKLLELFRLMVAGRDIPVEVVLVEHINDVSVRQEGYLLRIERPEECGR